MSEQDPIRVFATHCFDENDDYLRVFEFLESVDRFYYLNVSKPDNIPAAGGAQAIRDELIAQITQAETVLLLASVYEQQPDLVRIMMDIAKANKIKMIGIRPYGAQDTPEEIVERAEEVIEWNDREMVDAIKRNARGEETARWEVIDFPGFDADGPVE
ncbi:MAG: hypothetical protein WBM87_10430 [Woeseiaceae bacterium]